MRPYRTAIFVNGCFWHGHRVTESPVTNETVESDRLENSVCCKIPSTNRDFWVRKIRRNQERDQMNYRVLMENGWKVIVIWECELTPKRLELTMRKVEIQLNENMLSLYKRKPKPYIIEEEEPMPMAAEDD